VTTATLQPIRRARRRLVIAACVMILGSAAPISGQERQGAPLLIERQQATDLTEMPLEALMNLEVTSVSKKPQRVADAAAAIFVLTQEDMRRSGATTIAEALRLVPGLYVARIDSNVWVVNARGFTARFSTQFLVLVDGRAVYNPVFAGVFWDVVDMPLEDIDRIEVIRGPGAALWGANAVNGVVNIITKRARDTLGGLASGAGGTEEHGSGALRYGAKLGDVAVRAYAKYFNRDDFVANTPPHDGAGDEWEIFRGGFRADAEASERDTLTLIGNWYKGTVGETVLFSTFTSAARTLKQFTQGVEGLDILSRWVRTISLDSSLQLQLYYDRWRRDDLRAPGTLQTYDGELQYRFPLGTFNDVIAGLGYRYHHLDSRPGNFVTYVPPTADLHLFSAFVQDDVTLVKKMLHLILGTKLEHTTYSGLEWEPNARILWTPSPAHTLWGAVSRAVRTPSIAERQERFTVVIPPTATTPVRAVFVTQADSNPAKGLQSEKLLAYEVGYRTQPRPGLAFDIVAFYHYYTDLMLEEFESRTLQTTPSPYLLFTSRFRNGFDSEVYGIEFLSEIDPVTWWKFRVAYSWLERHDYRHILTLFKTNRNQAPSQQGSVRSLLDLGHGFELDVTPRWVSELPQGNARDYVELDARLGWRSRAVELALTGRNLLHSEHLEFNSQTVGPAPVAIQREVLLKATFRF
jgi:iron complex outermembrane receptor protein